MKLYEDNFFMDCQSEDDLRDIVTKMENATVWAPGITTSTLKVSPISGPIEAAEVARKTGVSIEAAYDTAEEYGTQILINYGGRDYLVRASAMRSIFDAAKISGSALGRLGPYKLSEVLNLCFSVAKGSSLILYRAEKVSAVHSDNGNGYKIMPVPELLDATREVLEADFGVPKYKGGFVSHESVNATWYLPDKQDEIMQAYQDAVKNTAPRIFSANFMPAVMFGTSDTSAGAAALIPHFITSNGGIFPLSDPIRVLHKRGVSEGVEYFREKSKELFSVFMSMKENIERLSSIVIRHPQNAFIGLCNKAGIAKKIASPALELFMQYLSDGDEPCMALDLYIGISEVMSFAKSGGYSGEQLVNLLETTSKILRYNMEDFDLAGTVAWSSN